MREIKNGDHATYFLCEGSERKVRWVGITFWKDVSLCVEQMFKSLTRGLNSLHSNTAL
jgi:hypothetical protein